LISEKKKAVVAYMVMIDVQNAPQIYFTDKPFFIYIDTHTHTFSLSLIKILLRNKNRYDASSKN